MMNATQSLSVERRAQHAFSDAEMRDIVGLGRPKPRKQGRLGDGFITWNQVGLLVMVYSMGYLWSYLARLLQF